MSRALTSLILALAIGLGNACICSAVRASATTHHRSCCEHSPHPATPVHHCSHCDGTAPPAQVAVAKIDIEPPTVSALLFSPIDVVVVGSQVASPADRKSTRLNSSHSSISYAVFCLKK